MKELGMKNISMSDSVMTYTNTSGMKTLRIAEKKKLKKNYMTLTDTNGVYQFDLMLSKQARPSSPDVMISLAKNTVLIKIADKNLKMNLDWKNNMLDMSMKSAKSQYS
jgi:hypothetical protein